MVFVLSLIRGWIDPRNKLFMHFFLFLSTVESSESQTVTGLDGWSTGKEETRAAESMCNPVEQAVATTQCGRWLSSPIRTVIVKKMHSSFSLYAGWNVIITMGTESVLNNPQNLDEPTIYPCSKLLKSFILCAGQINNCVIVNCAICLWV